MHAAHNFVSVWDDHEVEDNYADGLASSHAQPGFTNNGLPRRVSIQERRANAYQAYFNYMPRIRFDGERDRVYEHARIGKLVDLIITDERQYRNQQPCDDAQLVLCPDQQNPNRTMLGVQQKSWFKQTLATSPPDLEALGQRGDADGLPAAPPRTAPTTTSGTAMRPSARSSSSSSSPTTSRTCSRSPATSTTSSSAPPPPTGATPARRSAASSSAVRPPPSGFRRRRASTRA